MNQGKNSTNLGSFWDHLDVLRGVLLRCGTGWMIGGVVCFVFKELLFSVMFAPAHADFVLYRALCWLSELVHWSALCPPPFDTHFINTDLAAQFTTHIRVAAWSGLILLSPYVIYEFYGFISPALYQNEKKYSKWAISVGIGLFLMGVMLNYFLIFPLSFRFLSTYQVQSDIINHISLSSYISTFLTLSLLLGLLFEIPILGWLLAKLGLINADTLRRYRRHAFVAVLIAAAVITPTADAFTLMLVTIPIYLLYECTIVVVGRCVQST